VVRSAIDMSRSEFERRKQTLSVSLPDEAIKVEGDAVRLEQVFGNLLVNASKFTNEGGHAWLSVEHKGNGSPGEAVIKVRDDGVGIAPQMLKNIFDQFVQAEQSLDRARGGLGIGLTLAKRLVELHGGTIEAFSNGEGQGSEFTVHLPATTSALVPKTSGEPPTQGAVQKGSRKVLVVDDNVDSAISLRILLEMDGHQVDVAHDGPSALRKIAQFRPEIALLDIGLPGMDGYQVARELRHDGFAKDIWLVAVSGYGQEEHRRTAQEAGFDRYLVKPVDASVFLDLIGTLPARQAH
jgi:CheY-like chemotaxis protein